MGQPVDPNVASQLAPIPSGDLDALAEASAPGLQRVHRWIDSTGKAITISSEDSASVRLDTSSKNYLEYEISEGISNQDVTVSALNANSRTGRVYFQDLGRTVPFFISRDATPRTLTNLSRHLTRYVAQTNEWFNITFIPIRHADGRLKRIIITDCTRASDLE
jgi:hypothetical protein